MKKLAMMLGACTLLVWGAANAADGQTPAALSTHTFLVRWLATAQKQRRFPRTVAPDIDSLLKLGRQKGTAAGLYQRLDYLWQSCSNPVTQQSDLFRLTYAIESLKAQGWVNAAVADAEWDIPVLLAEYAEVSALLVKKSDLVYHFNDEGQLTGCVEFLVSGDAQHCVSAMQTQGLPAIQLYTGSAVNEHTLLTLLPA